jgi:hypothetical protein
MYFKEVLMFWLHSQPFFSKEKHVTNGNNDLGNQPYPVHFIGWQNI